MGFCSDRPRVFASALLLLAACANKPSPAPAVAPALAPEPAATPAEDPFAGRYETLTQRLESKLEEMHVPGMAVAVVHDDGVVYAHGFGYADVEEQVKATPRTMFAIGSSTKAFTSMAIGQLVDEGKMGWDDPLTQHVPEFVLDVKSDEKAAQATVRDALCHRTGFTRMGVLWASGQVPRNEFLAQASLAKPMAGLGEKFLYNNVTYTAAGEASARASGVLWAELVQSKILQPLGMEQTIVLSEEAKNSGKMAKGYLWEEDKSAFKAVPMRSLDEIAPAGAINSNVLDMTRWVRVQLGKGRFEGQQLIQSDTLAETWKPQMDVGGETKYGLGWFVDSYNGMTMLHHGGNIDGYSAMVSFIPEANVGFVMLSNVSYSTMQNAVRGIVYDTLLEAEADAKAEGDAEAEDLDAYVGEYVANFGAFAGKMFKVSVKDDVLFVDVPGQQNYELKPADKDGRRPFAVTDSVAVSFHKEGDETVALHMYQGGFNFELFRKGYVPEPELPLTQLEPLLGDYEHDAMGRAKVFVQNNRLAIDVPKQMVYELFPPTDEGHWRFRVKEDISIEFVPADAPKKVVLHQGGKTFELNRIKAKTGASGPTVAKLARTRRSAAAQRAFKRTGVLKLTGTIDFEQAGVSGTFEMYASNDGRSAIRTDLGKFGWSYGVVTPTGGWEVSSFGPLDELAGKRLAQAQLMHPLSVALDLQKVYSDVAVTGLDKRDGVEVVTVDLSSGELPVVHALLDAKTGDVVEQRFNGLWSGPGAIPVTESLSDYKTVLGLRLPHRIERSTPPSGTVTSRVQTVEAYDGVADDVFPAEPPKDE